MRHRLGRLGSLVLVLSSVLSAPFTHAEDRDKTDVITLNNGDRITGEIVSLEYGILRLKTSNMGTLSIEWPAVGAIQTRYAFHIERIGGARYFGRIESAIPDAALTIIDARQPAAIPLSEITRLSQVDAGFWGRLDGSFSLGYNFTKSSSISITSLALSAEYRGHTVHSSLSAGALSTKSPETGTSDRDQIASTTRFLRPRGRLWLALGSLERNEELGIEGRVQLGGAIGKRFVQRSDTELTGFAGLAFNQEWATGSEGGQQSLEAVIGSEWRIFRFATPETALNASLLVYPSITESGRYRAEFNSTLSREIVDDLTLDLTLYGSYDSEPPDQNVSTNDYGIVTSLGYKF